MSTTRRRHRSSRLMSRLRPTRLLCTTSTDDSQSNRRQTQPVEVKRLRPSQPNSNSSTPAHSSSPDTPHLSTGHVTSGCLTSDPTTCSTYNDVIERRHKRLATRLPTVDEPEVTITWSTDHVTGDDVIESLTTTRRRRKVSELRAQQQLYQFCGN